MQWEIERNTPGNWIGDKCLIDYLIYGEIVLKDEKIKDIIRWLVERNAHYDYIFRIPIEFPMVEDGLRSKQLQSIVDVNYKKYLDRSGLKYYTLTGSVEERVKQALDCIKNNPPNKR